MLVTHRNRAARALPALALVAALLAASARDACAQVRVTKGAGGKSTIDWSGFTASQTAAAALFRKTLQTDLVRSGWFAQGVPGNSEFSLQGSSADSGSEIEVKCLVYELTSRRNVYGKSYSAPVNETRKLAHQVANEIIMAVTGQRGLFGTRLVVVGNRTGHKELYLCEADGQNLVQLTRDGSISLAPKWGPEGDRIVYTSYIKRYPDLYVIDVASGSRQRIAGYPGLNTGGAISPNGREMAMILSKDGNPDLYIKNLSSGQITALTRSRAAEASPSWSPDGNRLVYVSDQAGTPQLYVVARSGGAPKRITSRGSENVAPDWGANGWIAFSSKVGRYNVCIVNPDTLEVRQITPGDADYEDPCWAPDGRHIACQRTQQYRSTISLLDTLGDPPVALLDTKGDWFSPAWSPK